MHQQLPSYVGPSRANYTLVPRLLQAAGPLWEKHQLALKVSDVRDAPAGSYAETESGALLGWHRMVSLVP